MSLAQPRTEKCFMSRLLTSEVRAVRQLFGNYDVFLKKKKKMEVKDLYLDAICMDVFTVS